MAAGRIARIAAVLGASSGLMALAAQGASAATTIGADVNQASNYTGACASPAAIPCTVVNVLTTPARAMQSPCDGAVVRFRLNGIATANTYRIRAVTDNKDGTWTPTATSAPPVTITSPGVSEYPANMPIKQGQYVGIDFSGATAGGLRGFGGPGFLEQVFYQHTADGTPDTPFTDPAIYLYNADVECGTAAEQPGTQCKKKKKKGKKKSAAAAKKKKKGCKKKKKKKKK